MPWLPPQAWLGVASIGYVRWLSDPLRLEQTLRGQNFSELRAVFGFHGPARKSVNVLAQAHHGERGQHR